MICCQTIFVLCKLYFIELVLQKEQIMFTRLKCQSVRKQGRVVTIILTMLRFTDNSVRGRKWSANKFRPKKNPRNES